MAKQSLHSPKEGLGRFVSPQRLALIAALGVITPAIAHAQTDAGVTTRTDSSRPDTGAATDSSTTPSPRVQVSTTPGDTCAGSFVCIPLITFNIDRVETINIAPVTGPVSPTAPTVAVATPTATSPARRQPARRRRPVRTTVVTTPAIGTPSASTEGQPVDLSTASPAPAPTPAPLPTPAPTPPTPETPPTDNTLEDDQSDPQATVAPVNPGTGGYFEAAIGGTVLVGTHTDRAPNFDNLSANGALRVTASNPTPELSANGPTGRYLVRLTIGGGSGNFTISIPGTNITNASGGNNFNIIAPAGMYTATITDNATQQTTTVPVTVAATRITTGLPTSPTTSNNEQTIHRDTLYLPTVTVRAGGRPVPAFDISGSLTWGVALERSTTRDAGGRIADTTTNVTFDTLAVGMRLGFVAGVFMIGTEGVATVSGVNRGYAQTLAIQFATSSQFNSALVVNLNAGIQVPFSDTARTGGYNPMFTAGLNVGYRFR